MDRSAKGGQVIQKLIRGIAKYLSPHPFVEILSIHLGHTLIEAGTFYVHKPLAVRWKEPFANKWLVEKLKENIRFPKFNNWINREIENETVLGKKFIQMFRNMSDQYWLLNLGFNGISEIKKEYIHFTQKEIAEAKKFMQKYKLSKGRYVCFCIRDESYYQKYKKDLAEIDPNADYAFRNANINEYISSAKHLASKGYKVLRMGFSETEKSSSGNSRSVFINPSEDKNYRPWIEAYLFKNCAFCVGMMTGGTLYASFFSRPILWTDVFWRGTPVGKKLDMIIPKLIYRKEGKARHEMLNLMEIRKMGPPKNNNWRYFTRLGLKVKNCSSNEITDGVKDMLVFLKTGRYFQAKEEKVLHKKFSALHYSIAKKSLVVPTRLAPSWAKKYSRLILGTESVQKTSQKIYNDFWQRYEQDEYMFETMFKAKKTKNLFRIKRNSAPKFA